jgi:hypothetical protein
LRRASKGRIVDLGGGKFEYQLNSNGVGGSDKPHGTPSHQTPPSLSPRVRHR